MPHFDPCIILWSLQNFLHLSRSLIIVFLFQSCDWKTAACWRSGATRRKVCSSSWLQWRRRQTFTHSAWHTIASVHTHIHTLLLTIISTHLLSGPVSQIWHYFCFLCLVQAEYTACHFMNISMYLQFFQPLVHIRKDLHKAISVFAPHSC